MSRERNTSGEKRNQELRFRLVKSMYKGENKGVG